VKTRSRIRANDSLILGIAFFSLLGSLLTGCASLPDTSGYTVATIQVKQAVATTGDVVKEELLASSEIQAAAIDADAIKKFEAAWKTTLDSLDAMVVYAQSIEQIVDAGNKGSESAQAVADSVKKLVDTVKADALAGASAEIFNLSTDTVAFVYGEFSKYWATKSLEEALKKFGPSIAKITVLVQAQIRDARYLFDEQIEAQIQFLETAPTSADEAGLRFGDWIKRHRALDQHAQQVTQLLIQAMQSGPSENIDKAKAMLADYEAGLKVVLPRIKIYETRKAALLRRAKTGRNIISGAENAVAVWGAAHQQMANSVNERKPVSVDSLKTAIVDIQTLIQRWREL
jgi:hypothetical protein